MTEQAATGIGVDHTLFCSAMELARARRRLTDPIWQAAADHIRQSAEKIITAERALPDMDTAWFDAAPERPFTETYVPFHHFIQPVMRLMQTSQTLGQIGLVLEEPRYLDQAAAWLMHVAENFKYHVRHHDSGMAYAQTTLPMAETFACVRERLSPTQQQRVLDCMAEAADTVRAGTEHWLTNLPLMPYSNHLAFQRFGLMAAGLLLDRRDWITEAIDGPRGFGQMLAGATYDDGLCYESSTNYHYATFGALLNMARMMRTRPDLGRDLFHETFANGCVLKQMFDAPLDMLLPSGELPPVGDCYARRHKLWANHHGTYEIGYAVYGDPRHAWLIQHSPRQSLTALMHGVDDITTIAAPGGRSRIWPEHGYGLLTANEGENYWNPDAVAPVAFVNFDRNGIHHHLDRGGLQIAAGGRIWLEDVEAATVPGEGHSFVARIQYDFNRTTLPHNLVMVNEQNHQRANRPFVIHTFRNLPDVKTLTIHDEPCPVYAGVRQSRTVAVTGSYVLDVCRVDAVDDAHEPMVCDLLLHPRTDESAEVGSLSFAADVSLPDTPPHSVLRDVQSASAAQQPLSLTWHQGDAAFTAAVIVMEGEPDRLFRAVWPVQSDWETGGREMFLFRARGKRVTFITLYQMQTDSPWHIESAKRYHNGRHDEIQIRTTNGTHHQSHTLYADDQT